jgi:hypothetical protein
VRRHALDLRRAARGPAAAAAAAAGGIHGLFLAGREWEEEVSRVGLF